MYLVRYIRDDFRKDRENFALFWLIVDFRKQLLEPDKRKGAQLIGLNPIKNICCPDKLVVLCLFKKFYKVPSLLGLLLTVYNNYQFIFALIKL